MNTKLIRILCCIIAALPLYGCAYGGGGQTSEPERVEIAGNASGTAAPIFTAAPDAATAAEAWVLFINAKKGDAALVAIDSKFYLIDTGREENADELISILRQYGVSELEGIFLTHSHKDHTGGLKTIANTFKINNAYRSDIGEKDDEGVLKLDKKLAKLGLAQSVLSAGAELRLGNGASLEVLAPISFNADDDNDNSLVMMLKVNGQSVLFTGDMQFSEEQTLLDSGAQLKADVLKVGNHGNPDATLDTFASSVAPKAAIISTNRLFDDDSANERVIAALPDSEIFITENDAWGVMARLDSDADGGISITYAAPNIEERAAYMRDNYYTALINRKNLITPDYVPNNLVKAADMGLENVKLKKDSIKGDKEAMLALKAMLKAAQKDGVYGFYLVSAYRDYAEQQALWDKKVAKDQNYGKDVDKPIVTAYPGASEHQTGLAFDIAAVDATSLSQGFSDTEQGKWLYAHCSEYGFILRYPKGKEQETVIVFEPWHFRYVGRELARYLTEHDMTLEKYYQTFYKNEG